MTIAAGVRLFSLVAVWLVKRNPIPTCRVGLKRGSSERAAITRKRQGRRGQDALIPQDADDGFSFHFTQGSLMVDQPPKFRSPPCMTIRGMTREEMAALRVLAARYGLSRESLIRGLLQQTLAVAAGIDAAVSGQADEPGGIAAGVDRESAGSCPGVDGGGDSVMPGAVATVPVVMSTDPAAGPDLVLPGVQVAGDGRGGMARVDPDSVQRPVWDFGGGVGRPLP